MWFLQIIRSFFFTLDSTLFNFIPTIYDFLIKLSRTSILSQGQIQQFAGRIQMFLGIFMLFKVAFSLVTYIVNPDDFSDKSKGFSKLGMNAIISLVLLIVVPYIFNMAFEFQSMILEENTLATIVFGNQGCNSEDDESCKTSSGYINSAGDKMAFTIMLPFFSPNLSASGKMENSDETAYDLSKCVNLFDQQGHFDSECKEELKNALNYGSTDTEANTIILENYTNGIEHNSVGLTFRLDAAKASMKDYEFLVDYNIPLSTVVAVVVLLLLITFCMDVALRSVKLAFLQLIAPIPIISYIDPKSGKDGLFAKWYKMCFSTYISLFVRLLALYLGVYIISLSNGMYDNINGSLINDPMVHIFIVIGVLMFAKQLPKILEGLGIKLDGGGKFNLNPFKKFEEEALGGKQIMKAGKGAIATAGAAGLAGATNFATRAFDKNTWRDKNGKFGVKSFFGGVGKTFSSSLAGTASATFRGGRKAIKGEKMGKIIGDSYGEAMFAKLQREDLKRKGATNSGIIASKFHQLTGTLDAAQRQTLDYGELENNHKAEVDGIKKQQEINKRARDAKLNPYSKGESAMKRINELISNTKDVKDAQDALEDLKHTGRYYVKAGDARLDENGNYVYKDVDVYTDVKDKNGNVVGRAKAKKRVLDTYTAADEAGKIKSYFGEQADKDLQNKRNDAYNNLKQNSVETKSLINSIKDSNLEILHQRTGEIESIKQMVDESDVDFENRRKAEEKAIIEKYNKLFIRWEDKDHQFNKAGMYKASDNVSEIKYEYDLKDQEYNLQIQKADEEFEQKLRDSGLDKNSAKWQSNQASHDAAPVKGKQPPNFMPSPSTSGASDVYGMDRVLPPIPQGSRGSGRSGS